MSSDEERNRFVKRDQFGLIVIAAVLLIALITIGFAIFIPKERPPIADASPQHASGRFFHSATKWPPPQPHDFNIPIGGTTISDALIEVSRTAALKDHYSFFSRGDTELDRTQLILPVRGRMLSLDAFCAVIRQAPGWGVVRIDEDGRISAVAIVDHGPSGEVGTSWACGDVMDKGGVKSKGEALPESESHHLQAPQKD
jgi:hypothetical protein